MVTGGKDYAQLAFDVARAGDIDGDGYADILVGAPFDSGAAGRVLLYRGSSSGPETVAAWSYVGDQPNGEAGFAVAGAGDLNGDGYDDVVVGIPRYSPAGMGNVGRVLVFYGSAHGLPAIPSVVLDGDQGGGGFGDSVAAAGDVNGDGYADLLVGQPYYEALGYYHLGRVFVYLGGPTGLTTSPVSILQPYTYGGVFGFAVAGAGDIDGDGRDDILVGDPFYDVGSDATENQGRVYLYLGTSQAVAQVPAWAATGTQYKSLFGTSVAGAGDVNGDGHRDVVIGARTWSSFYNSAEGFGTSEGQAVVFLGSAAGLETTPAWSVQGPAQGANLGIAVSGGGDVNGDGFDDVLVTASSVSHPEYSEGQVYLFYGSPTGPGTTPGWVAESNLASGNLGKTAVLAGDTNGDSLVDILIGTDTYYTAYQQEGAALLYEGFPTGNVPPHAHAGSYGARECVSPAGAIVTLDGSASTDVNSSPGTHSDIVAFQWYEGYGTPNQRLLGTGERFDVTLSLGVHAVTLKAIDSTGASGTDTTQVTVVDTTPPAVSVILSPSTLWPPNHRMVGVSAIVSATDACGPATFSLVSVSSNEPDDAPGGGDGATTGDIAGVGDASPDTAFLLRAERDGAGSGRIYTATYAASDLSGNVATAAAVATVPLSHDGVTEPLMITVTQSPAGTVVSWPDVAGAVGYDVIRGDIAQLRDAGADIDLGAAVCVAAGLSATSTSGLADDDVPFGSGFFYLVQYRGATEPVSFGTESAGKPRQLVATSCP